VERYLEEARRRLREVDYTLTAEDQKAFQLDLEIAQDVDAKKITREEALDADCNSRSIPKVHSIETHPRCPL
jgi:hypothetical protein